MGYFSATSSKIVYYICPNQCAYIDASSRTGRLRTHLKTHSGEMSNKCNQCDYASSQARSLKTHLKTHSGKSKNNATNVTLPLPRQSK